VAAVSMAIACATRVAWRVREGGAPSRERVRPLTTDAGDQALSREPSFMSELNSRLGRKSCPPPETTDASELVRFVPSDSMRAGSRVDETMLARCATRSARASTTAGTPIMRSWREPRCSTAVTYCAKPGGGGRLLARVALAHSAACASAPFHVMLNTLISATKPCARPR